MDSKGLPLVVCEILIEMHDLREEMRLMSSESQEQMQLLRSEAQVNTDRLIEAISRSMGPSSTIRWMHGLLLPTMKPGLRIWSRNRVKTPVFASPMIMPGAFPST